MYTAKLNSFNNQSQQARSAISFSGWFSKPKSPSEKIADMLGVPTSTGEEIIKTAQNVNDFVDNSCTPTQEMLKNCSDKEKYEMNFIANSFQKIKKIF